MTDRELMQQALEALNHVNVQDRVQIIAAIKEALAHPDPIDAPPQRPWVGLTKADTEGLWGSQLALAKDVEAKLRSKNQ